MQLFQRLSLTLMRGNAALPMTWLQLKSTALFECSNLIICNKNILLLTNVGQIECIGGDLRSCLIKSSRRFRNLKLGTLSKCKFSTQSSVFQQCLNSSVDVFKVSAQPNLSFVLLLFKSLLDTCGSYDAHCWSGLCSSSSPAHLELFKLRKNCACIAFV